MLEINDGFACDIMQKDSHIILVPKTFFGRIYDYNQKPLILHEPSAQELGEAIIQIGLVSQYNNVEDLNEIPPIAIYNKYLKDNILNFLKLKSKKAFYQGLSVVSLYVRDNKIAISAEIQTSKGYWEHVNILSDDGSKIDLEKYYPPEFLSNPEEVGIKVFESLEISKKYSLY